MRRFLLQLSLVLLVLASLASLLGPIFVMQFRIAQRSELLK